MNDDGGYTIYCSRCGAEMSSTSRYCMKCGNLNYEHESNKNMVRFMPKRKKKPYQVGSGTLITDNEELSGSKNLRMSVSSRTGDKKACFTWNYLIYLGILVLGFFITTRLSFSLDAIMASSFPGFAIWFSVMFLYIYSLELIFMKCNHPWWEALIPFYNYLVLSDIVFQNKWIGVLAFIPGVNIIFLMVLFYKLGESFALPKVMTALFFIVYIPVIGFGSHVYNGYMFISGDSQKEVEQEYKYRKICFFTIILFIILGFALSFMNSMTNHGGKENVVDGVYFTYASRTVVSKVEDEIKNNNVKCSNSEYSSKIGIYYFEFADVGENSFLFLYDMREPISGYVKVDNTSGESLYFVSLSDGQLGFKETLASEVEVSTITTYNNKNDKLPSDVNKCVIVH